MRTAKMFWRDMCLGTFRHGARFLIIPLVVVLMTAGLRNMLQHIRSGDDRRKRNSGGLLSVCYAGNVYL